MMRINQILVCIFTKIKLKLLHEEGKEMKEGEEGEGKKRQE